ncbi:Receptor-type tyrosine-protein phosphatase S [Xyrichtys novacula]|uniref:Receptor-type tyrosine-protein phosphatase S n=1 Tax=Xyrichtys novacula TaxID=13765 RepID=A0AAV1GFG7_XYRNO|nr:Receptor-type tyrosine-protein phosphatase S [Xyrichtys novacula]
MHPPQRQTFLWITFIPAVSRGEDASSCKSTHMNLADSKEDGALPSKSAYPC